ncbi:MAG: hypothetical protein GY784_14030, partial [Gammaproteobacteria bacterium]|nr:hypothetical protein [Gammaproteobacteria bacterium]
MKKLLTILIVVAIAGCASKSPLQQANLETNVVYRLTNPTLSTSLYVKLLSPSGDTGEL